MDAPGIALVEWMIKAIRAYVFAGLIFTIPFLICGIQRVDPDAKGWNIGFRLVIIPGLCVFWPLLAVRWVRGKRKPIETTAHRRAAMQATHQ
ncbi:MAG: hypothetical protein F6K00_34235 [Leptolyngbya sp. SIOISBB]|nr:hypothetical protein [Leptolyngbya sp. SIOISBB]